MDDIAERAGVSKPVLYQHFPGKLELYLALLDQSVDELLTAVRQALDSTDDNKQRVAATFTAYFEYVAGEGQAFRWCSSRTSATSRRPGTAGTRPGGMRPDDRPDGQAGRRAG